MQRQKKSTNRNRSHENVTEGHKLIVKKKCGSKTFYYLAHLE